MKCDPERFAPENKDNIISGSFNPFEGFQDVLFILEKWYGLMQDEI